MPKLNRKLLVQTMNHINDYPERHDQRQWVAEADAGPVACFAGWACLLSGDRPSVNNAPGMPARVTDTAGTNYRVIDRARMLLGLQQFEADQLFCPDNTRPDLARIVSSLLAMDAIDAGRHVKPKGTQSKSVVHSSKRPRLVSVALKSVG